MKVIALLTGRGNNTLRDKNILDLLGHPVLYYPAKAAKSSCVVNDWYCSSDDEQILKEAEAIGYKPIVRPKELALPTSQHIECIYHALEILRKDDNLPDILVVLLANNVTVKSKWITDCVNIMTSDMTISSVVPVYKDNDHHPYRAKKINKQGNLEVFVPTENNKISTNRQDLESSFFLCHNFWVLNVQNLLNSTDGQPPWSFMGDKIIPYIVEMSIDIHTEFDLHVAAKWLSTEQI